MVNLKAAFEDLSDPRDETKRKRHRLVDVMMIAVSGMICGAGHWTEIEDFGHAKYDWFSRFWNYRTASLLMTHLAVFPACCRH